MTRDSDRLHIAVRVILLQVLVAIAVAAVVFAIKGWVAGYSIMLGALTSIIPTAASSIIAFKLNDQDANMILVAFYSGAIIKYLLAAALIGLIIVVVKPLEPVMVLVGFIATQLAMLFAPLLNK